MKVEVSWLCLKSIHYNNVFFSFYSRIGIKADIVEYFINSLGRWSGECMSCKDIDILGNTIVNGDGSETSLAKVIKGFQDGFENRRSCTKDTFCYIRRARE